MSGFEQFDYLDQFCFQSINTFELLLDHYPENAQALNYLGYMLADRNLDLDYAKKLITKTRKSENTKKKNGPNFVPSCFRGDL